MEKKETYVIAFGGNALIKRGQQGDIYQQFANTREAVEKVVDLLKGKKINLVLTHGNGPQVGAIVIRSELTKEFAYYIPLGVAVAQSQGEIGYMIEQSLQNKLQSEKIDIEVAALLTQVVCDPNDPSIKNPSKPIGPFYTSEKIKEFEGKGIKFAEDSAGRGFRRVVPSPIPLDIIEKKAIKNLLDKNSVVIACGGGGMPVYRTEDNRLEGIDGVVDKDLASSVLASEIGADYLVILTDVEFVYLNFNTPQQKALEEITVNELKKYLEEGHFAKGSMLPKAKAAINFVEKGGKKAIITSIEKMQEALKGETGTHISDN